MADDLDAIDAREKAAPAGPWYVVGLPWNKDAPFIIAGDPDPHRGVFVADTDLFGEEPEGWEGSEEEWAARQRAVAEYVAAARADVPALVREVRALRAELDVYSRQGQADDRGYAATRDALRRWRARAETAERRIAELEAENDKAIDDAHHNANEAEKTVADAHHNGDLAETFGALAEQYKQRALTAERERDRLRAEVAERRERLARLRGLTPPVFWPAEQAAVYTRAVDDVLRWLGDLDVEPPPAIPPAARIVSAAVAAYREALNMPQRDHRPGGLHEQAVSAALTAAKKAAISGPLDVRQLLVHPALWDALVAWHTARGLDVGQVPTGPDDLPTYCMTPRNLPAAPEADDA